MKLSEAILLGSLLRPQAYGIPYNGRGTCAWGAAEEAIGTKFVIGNYEGLFAGRPEWSWTNGLTVCPVCHQIGSIKSRISNHLNDRHKWTREAIAEWVATLELQGDQHEHHEMQEAQPALG